MEKEYLSIDELKPYYLYKIRARNARYGIWVPLGSKGFLIRREDFGDYYIFVEEHWDEGPPFGTVRPLEELELTPFIGEDFIRKTQTREKYNEILNYLKNKTEEYDES
jgi:hypothetical protein